MRVRYAYRNLVRARTHLGISLIAISFAAFLVAAQGSLLYGFTTAASRIVDAIDADIWIVAPGLPTFELVSPIEERIAWLARGVTGVENAGRGLAGGPRLRNLTVIGPPYLWLASNTHSKGSPPR